MNSFDTLHTVGNFMLTNMKKMDNIANKIAKGDVSINNMVEMKEANVNVKVGARLIKMIDEMNRTVINMVDDDKEKR